VYALGNPRNLELTLSDGLISALRRDDDMKLQRIQTSAPISHGSSGGGLFDEEGRLIGITSSGKEDGQNLNFAIPINWMQELPARSVAALAKRMAATTVVKSEARPDGNLKRTGDDAIKPGARPAPPPSGYADLNDIDKLVQVNARAKAAYETFLAKPLPRAFALSESGGWWTSWGLQPKDPFASKDPAVRVVPDCEKYHQRRCYLYAVDEIVVYKPDQK
jgi:hypothetical protein